MTRRPQPRAPQRPRPAQRPTARARLARRRRQQRLVLLLLSLLSGGVLAAMHLWAAPPAASPALADPRALSQQGPQGPLARGQTVRGTMLTLSFVVPAARLSVVPDMEVVAVGQEAASLHIRGRPLPASARTRTVRFIVGPLAHGVAYGWTVQLRDIDGRSSGRGGGGGGGRGGGGGFGGGGRGRWPSE